MSGRTARKGRTSSSGLYVIKAPQTHDGHGFGNTATQTIGTVLVGIVLNSKPLCMPTAEPHLTILLSCRPSQCLSLPAPGHL